MENIKIYKFRSLGRSELVGRVRDILENGEFWCASLWAQNDPMEGIYTYAASKASEQDMDNFFTTKDRTRISSFSSEEALKEPTLWGHYANGFRGVAIEIEVEKVLVTKIKYRSQLSNWECRKGESPNELRNRMLTTKLQPWRREHEYRYFVESSEDCARVIGKITSVYFGDPLKGVENRQQVVNSSQALRDYEGWKNALIDEAQGRGYKCYSAQFAPNKGQWEVRWEEI